MKFNSQIKHHSKESDTLSIFFGQFPRSRLQFFFYNFPTARVGLSTATPQAIAFPTPFPGFPFLSLLQGRIPLRRTAIKNYRILM